MSRTHPVSHPHPVRPVTIRSVSSSSGRVPEGASEASGGVEANSEEQWSPDAMECRLCNMESRRLRDVVLEQVEAQEETEGAPPPPL